MKSKQLLALFVAVLLACAGMLAAQQSSRTEGTQDTGGDQEQQRTRAHAESWGPGQGLTLVGEVVSWNDQAIQVRTTTGIENVVLTPDTKMATQLKLKKETEVAVDYFNNNNTGAIVATQVRPAAAADREADQARMDRNQNQMHRSSGDQDLWVVGTVTRFDDDSLVLATERGDVALVLTPATQRTFAYKVGDPVSVHYEIGSDRQMMAQSIRQGTQDTGGDQEQRRTRASAESWGSGRGLTLVGEVVSWDDEALQVRTTTGIENVVLTQGTQMRAELEKGDRVAVDYVNNNNTGAIIATQVREVSKGSKDRGER